ncbi:MAG: enoyl-CoA hydratase/isomerase family protein [Thermosulfidibacteraceae bacterium]|jgi:enoyl-CoA hydratase
MKNVKIEISNGIGWVLFNRPESRNAFNYSTWLEVGDKVKIVDENPDVDVIILRGIGGSFSSGADIKEMLEFSQKGKSLEYQKAVNYCFTRLINVKKPTISLIEGYALGGGIMVALTTDIRIAEENAKIGIPLVKLGLVVEPLGIKRLVEVVGLGFATEFLMTGDVIPKEKLISSGVINYFIPREEIEHFTLNLVEKLRRENSLEAVIQTKRILREIGNENPKEPLLNTIFAQMMEKTSFKERAQKFINKK